jgi:branched-chain amino acid transport system substrate-binding protein
MNTKLFLGILFVCAIIVACAPAQDAQAPIKIGFMGPLSGDVAEYGLAIKDGVELAKKDMNLNVEIIYEDTGCEPQKAVTAATKLITVDKVQAIIGETCSGPTLAVAPIANEHKIVLLSASATSPKIVDAGPYVFRVIPSDALQSEFAGKMIYDSGARKIAIIYTNEDYGLGLADGVEANFKKQGGTVVAKEAVERGTVDVRTSVSKIKAAKPDAIFIAMNSFATAAATLRQLKEAGVTVQVYGSEGLKSVDVISGAQGAAEGMILSTVSAGTPEFQTYYKEQYGKSIPAFAAQGYDAMKTIALALEDPRSKDAFQNSIAAVEFDGASGHIKFDSNGEVGGNYDVFIVQGDEFVQK